jgi:hypothetical protein
MTDIRKKARVLLNAAREAHVNPDDYLIGQTAVCLAIEQHEAFKQEVSDVAAMMLTEPSIKPSVQWALTKFIIPKPKPDPLVEVIAECDDGTWGTKAEYANKFRAALEARGLEIREKGQ